MILFFSLITSVFVTMVLIPPLMRSAERLRVVDIPDARKVHTGVIPRIGGVAMVVGAILPIILWLPLQREVVAFLLGVTVIVFFGVWDDRKNLDYRIKFLGQIIAVLIVVFYGGVVIHYLPFTGLDPVPGYIAVPVTIFALLGVTNAINLADGLDGLAGGTTMLSLGMIAVLAYMVDGLVVVTIAVSVMGGILGFLRYNTYPARIFMGDGGSQFLGFSAGVLVIVLTQEINPVLSPAIAIMLLGLPILDTGMVMSQRIYEGRSPFSPDKNHIHHKLLALGFDHYEAVVFIYLAQSNLMLCAYYCRFNADAFILAIYGAFCVTVIGLFYLARKTGWRAHASHLVNEKSAVTRLIDWMRQDDRLLKAVFYATTVAIPAYLCLIGLFVISVPRDIGLVAWALLGLLVVFFVMHHGRPFTIVERAIAYVSCAYMVYLAQQAPGLLAEYDSYRTAFFVGVAVATAIGFRFSKGDRFRVTPMDILIIFIAMVVPNLPGTQFQEGNFAEGVAKVILLFYGIELTLQNIWRRWDIMRVATALPLVVLGIRAVL